MTKLTKRSVETLQIEAKDYFVWDNQIVGFGVRVMPSGAKTYQAQYRKGVGRECARSSTQTNMSAITLKKRGVL